MNAYNLSALGAGERRFVPASSVDVKEALKNCEAFATWAKRNNYKALVFPLAAFDSRKTLGKLKQLKQLTLEYGITLEAGGWDLSSLVPRRYFFLHKESFRMEGGRRKKDHHFCPTSLETIKIIGKEGAKIFKTAAGIEIFHLWPDKGAESLWCSCPTCRAFSFQEQARIAVNAAADVLATINPSASITCFEKSFEKSLEACKISLRKNIIKLDSLCIENLDKVREPFNSCC